MADYDLEGARQAGVSDADIASALAPKLNYDLEGARKAGVPEKDIAEALTSKFNSTAGGAATGNPSIMRQGAKALRSGGGVEPLLDIGAATGIGAGLGAASKELLTGAGNVLGALPYPFAQTAGRALKGAGILAGAAGRGAGAASGAAAGAIGETAGQAVDLINGGETTPTGELTRFVAGGIGPETVKIVPMALKALKNPLATGTDVLRWISQATGKEVGPSSAQAKYVEEQLAALRGVGGKTNQPLEEVGSIMSDRGRNLMDFADQQLIAAQQRAAGVQVPGQARELADIGGNLQSTINTRYKGAIDARRAEYSANEKARDSIVSQREGAGQSIDTTPEYQTLVANLKAELKPGLHSPDVAGDFENILKQISTKAKDEKPPFGGLGADPFSGVGEKKPPVSFQQIDEVRRQLGEVFRGKPPEGYKAIDAETARKYYGQLSDLQKKYAGEPQAKLLDEYAQRTEGLNIFSSKYGKKSTALDQYREDTFATDPSSLPSAYFKTRVSVQALKELTGSQPKVNAAALEYANKQLAGKDADGVRKWLSANSEWLSETGPTRTLIDRYATKLEGVERQTNLAKDFVAQAAKSNDSLVGKGIPANQAVALINSKDADLWNTVIPAIKQSPQAQQSMIAAVRQTVANQATSKGTADLFELSIRPFLEKSNIASKAEMDFIAEKLANIQRMNVPEAEKLGIYKRILLQGSGGWAASAASRGTNNAYQWSRAKMVPE